MNVSLSKKSIEKLENGFGKVNDYIFAKLEELKSEEIKKIEKVENF